MQKLINSGQKDWKWNLEGPGVEQALLNSIRKTESPLLFMSVFLAF